MGQVEFRYKYNEYFIAFEGCADLGSRDAIVIINCLLAFFLLNSQRPLELEDLFLRALTEVNGWV